jgi:prepilin-type N-terminal cleavage/methylation domain-containing protein
MSRTCRANRGAPGFTLIEILVALALLGVTAVVLLNAHYGAMRLFTDTRDEVLMQGFMERALGQAEVEVLTGSLTGTGTFGDRYPDYSYSYTAQLMGSTETVPLYTVTVSVTGPENETKSMTELVYNTSQ